MKLDNMFKKTRRPSGKKGHIGGRTPKPGSSGGTSV